MLELRLTVFRDNPAPELLKTYTEEGYNLYHDRETSLFYLTDETVVNFDLDGFGTDYHRVLNIPFDYDWSYLKTFKAQHTPLLEHVIIHDEILIDALALSHAFSTRVLCVYSNDEDCDFAVTAENGKLLRLRIKGGSKQGKRVDDEDSAKIITEIQAVRVLVDGESLDDDAVFEFKRFEIMQTEDTPLALNAFWHYREGEIGGHVMFDTLSSSPEGTEPNLMFRNAFLEFEAAFGKSPPDFTDMPEKDRFQRIAFQSSPRISGMYRILNFQKSVLSLPFKSLKTLVWTLGIILILCMAVFSENSEPPQKPKTFADYCTAAKGTLSSEFKDECKIDAISYRNWNLPGVKGERRIMILKIGPEKVPCNEISTKECLFVDGGTFEAHIEGYTFRAGKTQIVPVERIQICDPATLNDCPLDAEMFLFKQLLNLE